MSEKIPIGKILKPHGVKGAVVFLSFSGDFELDLYSKIYIRVGDSDRELKINSVKPYRKEKKHFLIQFETLGRSDVEMFYHHLLYVDELPYHALESGEFFYRDLENCSVFCGEEFLGHVIQVHNFSGPEVVEIEHKDKKNRTRSLFLPLMDDFLKELDIAHKKIVFEINAHDFL